jgi:hypothetical protein
VTSKANSDLISDGIRTEKGQVYVTVHQTLGNYGAVTTSSRRITTIMKDGTRVTTIPETPPKTGPNFYTFAIPEQEWQKMQRP